MITVLQYIAVRAKVGASGGLGAARAPGAGAGGTKYGGGPPSELVPSGSASPLPGGRAHPDRAGARRGECPGVPPGGAMDEFSGGGLAVVRVHSTPCTLQATVSIAHSYVQTLIVPRVLVTKAVDGAVGGVLWAGNTLVSFPQGGICSM